MNVVCFTPVFFSFLLIRKRLVQRTRASFLLSDPWLHSNMDEQFLNNNNKRNSRVYAEIPMMAANALYSMITTFFLLSDLIVLSIMIIHVWSWSWTTTQNSMIRFFSCSLVSIESLVNDEVRIPMRIAKEERGRRRRRRTTRWCWWWWWREREKNNIRDMQTRLIRGESSGVSRRFKNVATVVTKRQPSIENWTLEKKSMRFCMHSCHQSTRWEMGEREKQNAKQQRTKKE